jgi:hypothetical protein
VPDRLLGILPGCSLRQERSLAFWQIIPEASRLGERAVARAPRNPNFKKPGRMPSERLRQDA